MEISNKLSLYGVMVYMSFSCMGGKAGRHTINEVACQVILFCLARLVYPVKVYLVPSTVIGSLSRLYLYLAH